MAVQNPGELVSALKVLAVSPWVLMEVLTYVDLLGIRMDVGNFDRLLQTRHPPFVYRDLPRESKVLLVCDWRGMSCLPILGLCGLDHCVALSASGLQLGSHYSRHLWGRFEDTVCICRIQHGH
jgi:hypothetical protein